MGTVPVPTMKAVLLLLAAALASGSGLTDPRFTCMECVQEMHRLGYLVRQGAHPIHDYLAANYCPTTDDEEFCKERLSRYYVAMLFAIVNHYFVDGGCTSARPWASARPPGSTPARSAWRGWSGWRPTSRTPSWWRSTWSTSSSTSVSVSGRTARTWW